MRATYGLVPVGLLVILTLSRSLGLVKMAQKVDAAKKPFEKKEVDMSSSAVDPSKEKTS